VTHYSGITTNLKTRKAEHEAKHPDLRNWKFANNANPFASKDAAQAWENSQPGEHHPGGAPAQGPWFGYSFDYGL
jgi:hypothetical protein